MELLPFLKLNWTWLQIAKKHIFVLYWLNNLITALQLILHTVHLMLYEIRMGYYKPREHFQHIKKINIVVVRCCFEFHVTPREKKWLAWHLPVLIILVLIAECCCLFWWSQEFCALHNKVQIHFCSVGFKLVRTYYHDAVFY